MDYPTKQETIYKIKILDLLIAIDEDIVDWRNYPKLYTAVRCADAVLDIWAGMNLKQIKEEAEAYIRGIEDYEEEPYQE
tara:strand:+ start:437 stop:673 length:237 start_codon:yes stop_codon:yes gene_type:complete